MNKKIMIPFVAIAIIIVAGVALWQTAPVTAVINTPAGSDSEGKNPPNSAEGAPSGSIHNLPVPEAVTAAKAFGAKQFGVAVGEILVLTAFEKEWPDACLGVQKQDILCAQVITPGWEVTIMAKGQEVEYHTNADGSVIVENK